MENKICTVCNKKFIPNSGPQKFCSNKCFGQYYKKYRREYYKKYWIKNKKKLAEQSKNWYLKNRKRMIKWQQIWWKKNGTRLKHDRKLYDLSHRTEIRERQIKRRKTNLNFRLLCCLRARLNNALKDKNKSSSTLKLLGCSIGFLKKHIESRFKLGMSWNNYGRGWNNKGMKQWHIDHIKPCTKFDLSKPEDQHKCFHYTNLQPLWAEENLSKGIKNV